MKKIVLIMMALAMLLTACGDDNAKKNAEEAVDSVANSVAEEELDDMTLEVEGNDFYKMMQTNNRPIAVMIDNDEDVSRPQMGLESAFMVYEMIIEGGKSRLMALFKEYDLEKVGPIRSSRHYFLDYALEHDAIYCHAGWSPKAQTDISSLGVNNINGILGGDGNIFWRDSTYDTTWHNLYSGVDKLYNKAITQKGYRDTTEIVHDIYHKQDVVPENGESVVSVNIPYSNIYRVSYEYDEEKGVYKRYVDGKAHMSQTGEILTAKNIIVYKVENFKLNDGENKGRQDLNNVGSGKGYYITNGESVDITWSKSSRTAKTVYTTEDGEELMLNPGNTYVQIVPASSSITLS